MTVDDFAAIRARMDELRREREEPEQPEHDLRARVRRLPIEEIATAISSTNERSIRTANWKRWYPTTVANLIRRRELA